jgi:lysozyme family protein
VVFRAEAGGLSYFRVYSSAWQQRVQDARRRSEELVANARMRTADPPPSEKDEAEAADQRALNESSVQPGDIVATNQDFFVFVGCNQ